MHKLSADAMELDSEFPCLFPPSSSDSSNLSGQRCESHTGDTQRATRRAHTGGLQLRYPPIVGCIRSHVHVASRSTQPDEATWLAEAQPGSHPAVRCSLPFRGNTSLPGHG